MNDKVAVRRPYMRPMQGWWRRNPFFMRYMAREMTAVAVLAYAIMLMLGVMALARGQATWNAWLDVLRTPWSLLLHLALLVAMFVHAKSWFEIMPKTLPMIVVGGKRLPAAAITYAGWGTTIIVSVAVLALAWWCR